MDSEQNFKVSASSSILLSHTTNPKGFTTAKINNLQSSWLRYFNLTQGQLYKERFEILAIPGPEEMKCITGSIKT